MAKKTIKAWGLITSRGRMREVSLYQSDIRFEFSRGDRIVRLDVTFTLPKKK